MDLFLKVLKNHSVEKKNVKLNFLHNIDLKPHSTFAPTSWTVYIMFLVFMFYYLQGS